MQTQICPSSPCGHSAPPPPPPSLERKLTLMLFSCRPKGTWKFGWGRGGGVSCSLQLPCIFWSLIGVFHCTDLKLPVSLSPSLGIRLVGRTILSEEKEDSVHIWSQRQGASVSFCSPSCCSLSLFFQKHAPGIKGEAGGKSVPMAPNMPVSSEAGPEGSGAVTNNNC